jgi:glycine betaine/proline transport system substrate-binding protein
MVQPSDSANWYKDSYVASKDALKQVQVAFSNSLQGRSPAIADFLANMKLDAKDVSGFAYEVAGLGRDPAEVAKEWVAKNSARVDAWLGM